MNVKKFENLDKINDFLGKCQLQKLIQDKHGGTEKSKSTDNFKGNYFKSSRNRFLCYLNYSKPAFHFSVIIPALYC